MKTPIYLDYNATTPVDPTVVDAMLPYLRQEFGNPSSTHGYGKAAQTNVIQFLTFDQKNTNSILSCLRAARENARSVREIISSEMWEQLNEFYLMVNSAAAEAGKFCHRTGVVQANVAERQRFAADLFGEGLRFRIVDKAQVERRSLGNLAAG